ncbi:MAG: hypothetical protein ACRDJ4_12965 [Actinomycetota bacterium]
MTGMHLASERLTARRPAGTMVAAGVLLIAGYSALLVQFMNWTSFDVWGALLVGPVLVAVTLPGLARQAAREGNSRLLGLFVAALLLKLGAAVAAHFVAFDVYQGVVDLNRYHNRGLLLARRFLSGDFSTGMETVTGTSFPILLNGIIYFLIGPTKLGGFMVHAWFGFLGLFFLYRAFVLAVPEGKVRTYGRLVFFLPSSVFWSSLMGKDPWMLLGVGIAAYGAARVFSGQTWRGAVNAGLGIWMTMLIRPHVGGMLGVALVAGFLAGRRPARLGSLAPVAKTLGMLALGVAALFLVGETQQYLEKSGIETQKGLSNTLEEASRGGNFGGSAFAPSIPRSPLQIPGAAFTVLFRPLPHEVDNLPALIAGVEGSLLIGLTIVRFRWITTALRSVRRQPYVAFAAAYVGMFVIAFSSMANFGLLVRQRVQMLPLFLVLLSVPPVRREEKAR